MPLGISAKCPTPGMYVQGVRSISRCRKRFCGEMSATNALPECAEESAATWPAWQDGLSGQTLGRKLSRSRRERATPVNNPVTLAPREYETAGQAFIPAPRSHQRARTANWTREGELRASMNVTPKAVNGCDVAAKDGAQDEDVRRRLYLGAPVNRADLQNWPRAALPANSAAAIMTGPGGFQRTRGGSPQGRPAERPVATLSENRFS
jgi:hypothetical protein